MNEVKGPRTAVTKFQTEGEYTVISKDESHHIQPNNLFLSIYNTTPKNSTSPRNISNLSVISLRSNLEINPWETFTLELMVSISRFVSPSLQEEVAIGGRGDKKGREGKRRNKGSEGERRKEGREGERWEGERVVTVEDGSQVLKIHYCYIFWALCT